MFYFLVTRRIDTEIYKIEKALKELGFHKEVDDVVIFFGTNKSQFELNISKKRNIKTTKHNN